MYSNGDAPPSTKWYPRISEKRLRYGILISKMYYLEQAALNIALIVSQVPNVNGIAQRLVIIPKFVCSYLRKKLAKGRLVDK